MARHRIQINSIRMIEGMVVVHELQLRLGKQITSNVEQRVEGDVQAIYFDADANVNLDFLRPHILPPKYKGVDLDIGPVVAIHTPLESQAL